MDRNSLLSDDVWHAVVAFTSVVALSCLLGFTAGRLLATADWTRAADLMRGEVARQVVVEHFRGGYAAEGDPAGERR